MKVEVIKYPTSEDWILCKQCALVTIGKTTRKEPTWEWKHDILKARHSPIRELKFVFFIEGIPSWIATHLARHVHAQPYIQTQRNDRQVKYDRRKAPQDAPVNMMWSVNAEELMTIANKRLCMLASEETREVIQLICEKVLETNSEFANLLVPMCQYGRCHEMYPCHLQHEE